MRVTLTIPGVPVPKGRPRFRNQRTKSGAEFVQTYTPAKTRSYAATVRALAKLAMGRQPPLSGPLHLNLVAFLPIPSSWPKHRQAAARAGLLLPTSKPDLDNIEKTVTDACNGVVYGDDALICDVVKAKRYAVEPRVVVEVMTIDPRIDS
ncbi:RusA family crossover junction endodeoxyribonuclease [Cupriavidus alkaliphilus]|uniref:RusA family crossover junction endodeoxyribonuclease n=1 Tax=Cupriavidus alkaliphilus TaxID=942866 RepID=UPI00161807F3|nr:RusA family crossover junction endodeoxyribonuclease [Cupriavidus alkaliphilus]MBB2915880.1 Holliday junction resolvase RusA-like endonuclease [Cupriavidus alkaliphilus]